MTRTLITASAPSRQPGAVPTAPVGRLLAQALAGTPVRVLVPRSEAEGWPSGTDVVVGDVTDPDATPDAFADVDRVFLAGLAGIVPRRLRELTNRLVAGSVAKVVVLASHGSDFESEHSAETWEWLAFERALQRCGANWVYLRPGGLFANAAVGGYPITGADWLATTRAGEPVREFRPDVAYPFIDEADLATIAARLLTDDSSGTVDVVGALTSAHARAALAGVRLAPLSTVEQARTHWRHLGWPDVTIEVTLYAMQALEGAGPALRAQIATARALLGREPRGFADWLNDHRPPPPR